MIKIIADQNIPYVQQAFGTLGQVVTLPGRSICCADLQHADVLLVRSVTAVNAALLKETAVRLVASATSGTDHIDFQYLQDHDIAFAHAPGCNALSVAEYVLSVMAHWSLIKNRPFQEISVGLIGCGHVGSQVKRLCEFYGMQVLVHDPPLAARNPQLSSHPLEVALGCDIISLHVPLVSSGKHRTQKLLTQAHFQQLMPQALLINTSRGEVLDEQALCQLLKSNHDFSAVIDVWQHEPNIDRCLLAKSLLGTAHIAGHSYDGKINGTDAIYLACCQYFDIEPTWSANNVRPNTEPFTLPEPHQYPQTQQGILDMYDVCRDSQSLKSLLTNPKLSTGKFFDQLRADYHHRRDWSQGLLKKS